MVNISIITTVTIPGNSFRQYFGPESEGPFGDFFKHFFQEAPDQKMKQQSLGSGSIIDRDGFIITNNHVVDNADEINVKLVDGREFKAKVVGRDTKTALALIKIGPPFENLPVLAMGNSENIRVGDWVLAVGNPFGLGHTVTQEIISATGRVIGSGPYDDFLQTDAPINPGNSGGPLVNIKGEVIGINTAIVSGGQGLGFAIPRNMAKSVTTQLREKGKVVRGWIGVSIQTVTPDMAKSFGLKEPRGALIAEVAAGGPADKGGARQGDIIVTFNGKEVISANDLPRMVAETPVGKEVNVTVFRNGKGVPLRIKVEELTEERIAALSHAPAQSFGMKVDNLSARWRQQFGISDKSGAAFVGVEHGSMAEKSGIQPGDVIKEVNHKPVRNLQDFNVAMATVEKGQSVLILLQRGKETFFVTMESVQ